MEIIVSVFPISIMSNKENVDIIMKLNPYVFGQDTKLFLDFKVPRNR